MARRRQARAEPRPKMSDQSRTDRLAMNAVERLFLENGSHELEIPSRDYGRDGRLIFNVEGAAQGYSTSLQVKGTSSTDTESHLAFQFRCEVKTLLYLNECQAPAYFVVHNVVAGTTYAREVHDLMGHLDAGRLGWRRQDRVTVTFQSSTLLTSERVKRIASEAKAWAMERQTTWGTVQYIDKAVRRYASVRSTSDERPGESFVWMALRGGFVASSAADTMAVLLFMANLMHGLTLCSLYRQRMKKAMSPHQLSSTAFGTMDLTDLTERLGAVRERHRRLAASSKIILKRAAPDPVPNEDWIPPRKRGLIAPKIDASKAQTAASRLQRYLERLGLSVRRNPANRLDLIVQCERATGLLSMALYGRPTSRARIRQVRERLG